MIRDQADYGDEADLAKHAGRMRATLRYSGLTAQMRSIEERSALADRCCGAASVSELTALIAGQPQWPGAWA